jgi:hypothetical protein
MSSLSRRERAGVRAWQSNSPHPVLLPEGEGTQGHTAQPQRETGRSQEQRDRKAGGDAGSWRFPLSSCLSLQMNAVFPLSRRERAGVRGWQFSFPHPVLLPEGEGTQGHTAQPQRETGRSQEQRDRKAGGDAGSWRLPLSSCLSLQMNAVFPLSRRERAGVRGWQSNFPHPVLLPEGEGTQGHTAQPQRETGRRVIRTTYPH